METKISEFYGTTIYMKIDLSNTPNIIAKHEFEDTNEICIFNLENGNIINGEFSDDERYDDVKEWIHMNKKELLNMWNTQNMYEIGGIE